MWRCNGFYFYNGFYEYNDSSLSLLTMDLRKNGVEFLDACEWVDRTSTDREHNAYYSKLFQGILTQHSYVMLRDNSAAWGCFGSFGDASVAFRMLWNVERPVNKNSTLTSSHAHP